MELCYLLFVTSITCALKENRSLAKYEIIFQLILKYKYLFFSDQSMEAINEKISTIYDFKSYKVTYKRTYVFIIHENGSDELYKFYYKQSIEIYNCGDYLVKDLDNKYLCKVYDIKHFKFKIGDTNAYMYITLVIMEYLEMELHHGINVIAMSSALKAHVKDVETLNMFLMARNMIFCITSAIDCLQKNNLVNLNIQPETIMFNIENAKVTYKLTNFSGTHSFKDSIIGYVCYTSGFEQPEWLYHRFFTISSDVWSLGMLIVSLIINEYYDDRCDLLDSKYHKFITSRIEIINQLDLDDNLKDFILQCLIKEPEKRPSASMLLQHAYFAPLTITKKHS
ncbi:Protein kinase C signaling pathway involved MAPKK protein [Conglomerata obtusa]